MAGIVDPQPEYDAAHRYALGKRLHALRRSRGMSMEAVSESLHVEVCMGTISSYEVGERRMTVQRLVELCGILGTTAAELLEQVDRDLTTDPTIWVRSRLLTMTKDPDLQSLRAWAKAWVKGLPRSSQNRRHIPFGPAPLREAAELCGLSVDELADRLRRLE